jgi:hypothetical protein
MQRRVGDAARQDLSRERVLHGTTQFAAKMADSMVRTRTLYTPRNEKYVRITMPLGVSAENSR